MKIISSFLAVAFCLIICACDNENLQNKENLHNGVVFQQEKALFVNYIDVQNGDCVYIECPNGKTLLIDCGKDNTCYNKLKSQEVSKIDYLILSHPDNEHIGGLSYIISNFAIGKAYLPYFYEDVLGEELYNNFQNYKTDKINLVSKIGQENIIYNKIYNYIIEDDVKLIFLSPLDSSNSKSSYKDFMLGNPPSEQQIDNISPIIYMEYKGIRFIFSGDSGEPQEKIVLENDKFEMYNTRFSDKNITIDLENIDYFYVPKHGGNGSCSEDYINKLKPKYAIISVGGSNIYGNPTTAVLSRITTSNENCQIYRTDRYGDISVEITETLKTTIKVQSQN